MTKDLELKLVQKYPTIFKDYGGDMRKTCMAWGFECGDGWYDLINKLCSDISKIDSNVIAIQVKEKYGTLRFYFYYINTSQNKLCRFIQIFLFKRNLGIIYNKLEDIRRFFFKTKEEKIQDLIWKAEDDSAYICEICGEKGELFTDGWYKTRCENHRND